MRGEVLKADRQGLEIYNSIKNPKVKEFMGLLSAIQQFFIITHQLLYFILT